MSKLDTKIYLSSPHMSKEGFEQEYIKTAFDTNWIAPLGENVVCFEKEFAEILNVGDAVALTCGTAAIHMALKAVGIKPNDIVFCSSLTFSATVNPVLYEQAIPVFIDSDYDTWNMSPKALEKAFEKYGDRVKAVVVVHLYGLCANMQEIMNICRKYNVPIIEDAAESLGSIYNGQWTGSIGDYGIFSFNGNKIITTSGGGMLICNIKEKERSEERIKKVRFWSTQAKEPARFYQHSEIGYNYRMSNILAGIGRGQLRVLKERIEKKRAIYFYYFNVLSNLLGVTFMPMLKNTYSNCWLTCMLIDFEKCGITPDQVMDVLEEGNIESRPIWKPMQLQPVFSNMDYISDGNVSQYLFEHGVCLPSDTKMTCEDLERICSLIASLWIK